MDELRAAARADVNDVCDRDPNGSGRSLHPD